MILDLFEDKSKQSGEFDNEAKVGRDVIGKDTWILTDAGEHVMTYI